MRFYELLSNELGSSGFSYARIDGELGGRKRGVSLHYNEGKNTLHVGVSIFVPDFYLPPYCASFQKVRSQEFYDKLNFVKDKLGLTDLGDSLLTTYHKEVGGGMSYLRLDKANDKTRSIAFYYDDNNPYFITSISRTSFSSHRSKVEEVKKDEFYRILKIVSDNIGVVDTFELYRKGEMEKMNKRIAKERKDSYNKNADTYNKRKKKFWFF